MIEPKSLIIPHLEAQKTCYVAYSGGVDSTVLLYEVGEAAKDLKCNVVAIHINHEYSKKSKRWEKHCESFCKNYGFEFKKFSFNSFGIIAQPSLHPGIQKNFEKLFITIAFFP